MARAFILSLNQLFKSLPPDTFDKVILIEDSYFFTDFRFHKKSLFSMSIRQHEIKQKADK